jgi:uncharacterized protein YndB with AHSA1/START domain
MQDVIVREITVRATQERVYNAITDPQEIIKWFPEAIEGGTLEVGQRPIFIFNNGEHKSQTYIEAAHPFDYFAYRWIPGTGGIVGDVLAVPNTLVEFRIEATESGTKVTLKESGFSSLPANVAEEYFLDNSGGWEFMMNRFEQLMS